MTGLSANRGGIENIVSSYITRIADEDIQFDLLVYYEDIAYMEAMVEVGCKIIKIPLRMSNPIKYYFRLFKLFRHQLSHYDVIWCNKLMLTNIDVLILAKMFKIKTRIVHSHCSQNLFSGLKGKFHGGIHKINKLLLHFFVNEYWSCSTSASQWMFSKKVRKSKSIRIIRNSIDEESFRFNDEKRIRMRTSLRVNDDFIIGHVGMFAYVKNHDFLLDVFQEILKNIKNAKLMLIGEGFLKSEIVKKAKNLGIYDKVMFMGIRDDVNDLMQAMDCFVLTSHSEGFGIALIEAQAAGLPCYVSAEAVVNEANLTGLVEYISLNRPAKNWAASILQKKPRCINAAEAVVKSGYSINEEALKMKDYIKDFKNKEIS